MSSKTNSQKLHRDVERLHKTADRLDVYLSDENSIAAKLEIATKALHEIYRLSGKPEMVNPYSLVVLTIARDTLKNIESK